MNERGRDAAAIPRSCAALCSCLHRTSKAHPLDTAGSNAIRRKSLFFLGPIDFTALSVMCEAGAKLALLRLPADPGRARVQ